MNRNQLYEYLKNIGLKPLIIKRDRRNRQNIYHVVFVENYDTGLRIDSIVTEWGYLSGFNRINLYAKEIVLEGEFENSQVNINYNDLKKFEVIITDEDEIERIL